MLAALAVLLVFAAAWELAGGAGERIAPLASRAIARLSGGRAGSLAELGGRLGLPGRIERAGVVGADPRAVVAAKLAGAFAGALVGALIVPVLGARLAIAAFAGLVVAGFLAPDAWLERAAIARRRRFVAALPDALDLLAVGAASGRNPASGLASIAATGAAGPLTGELARMVAEVECGRPLRDALAALRRRVPGAEIGALAAALERSRTYGSPLADQLHLQATGLRRAARRRIEDRAARSAPKIQLVVALVLVPSVLLALAAALVAHSDELLGQF